MCHFYIYVVIGQIELYSKEAYTFLVDFSSLSTSRLLKYGVGSCLYYFVSCNDPEETQCYPLLILCYLISFWAYLILEK